MQKRYVDKQREEDDSDVESVQSEEFEELLDKMAGVQGDEDIDYMEEIGDKLKTKDKKKKSLYLCQICSIQNGNFLLILDKISDNEDEFEDNEDELDDDDNEFDDNESEFDEELDDDENELEFDDNDKGIKVFIFNSNIFIILLLIVELLKDLSDDNEEEIEFLDEDIPKKNKKGKLRKKGGISSIFASADEFATLLEEEGISKQKPGGSNAVLNADNSRKFNQIPFRLIWF